MINEEINKKQLGDIRFSEVKINENIVAHSMGKYYFIQNDARNEFPMQWANLKQSLITTNVCSRNVTVLLRKR